MPVTSNLVRVVLIILLIIPSIVGCMGNIGGQFGHMEPAQTLPPFPAGWPPPEASSYTKIANSAFYSASTIGDAMSTIAAALYDNGYTEVSYFSTKDGGVALVTSLERFADDGSVLPQNERWSSAQGSKHDLLRMLRNMYFNERGRYRVFVFFLGPALPWEASSQIPTLDEAGIWWRKGTKAVLPTEVANRPLGNAQCTVAVYEFESTGRTAKLVTGGAIPVALQLRQAGIVASLSPGR